LRKIDWGATVRVMRVHLLWNNVTLGAANLTQLDPPMGVAMGSFEASDHYDQHAHANVIEGAYIGDKGISFVVVSDTHGQINCANIAIEDFAESMDVRQLTLFGIPYPEYVRFFGEYDDYKAYYPTK
jgi:hypothetical protein